MYLILQNVYHAKNIFSNVFSIEIRKHLNNNKIIILFMLKHLRKNTCITNIRLIQFDDGSSFKRLIECQPFIFTLCVCVRNR